MGKACLRQARLKSRATLVQKGYAPYLQEMRYRFVIGFGVALGLASGAVAQEKTRFGLRLGADAERLARKLSNPPDRISYVIESASLPAAVTVVLEPRLVSGGVDLTGEGVFAISGDVARGYYEALRPLMGERLSLREGQLILEVGAELDAKGRSRAVDMFGLTTWYQPHDCFATLGVCETVEQTSFGEERALEVHTSERGGFWKMRAYLKGTRRLVYAASYTVDEAGFLIDETRVQVGGGARIRTKVRRAYQEGS